MLLLGPQWNRVIIVHLLKKLTQIKSNIETLAHKQPELSGFSCSFKIVQWFNILQFKISLFSGCTITAQTVGTNRSQNVTSKYIQNILNPSVHIR